MKKILTLAVALFSLCQWVDAVIVQKVYLKDGSVLSGYVKQIDMNGGFTVATDMAMVCLNDSDAYVANEQPYPESQLDEAWIKWAEQNDEFLGEPGSRTLTLSDVYIKGGKFKSGSVHKVKVLEKGKRIKYLEMSVNEYNIKGEDVVEIKGEKRSKTALSGIDRIFQLKTGQQYEGQYAGETASTLSLFLKNGVVQTFQIEDVVKYTYKAINPNQNLFEQSPLLDVVIYNNNAEMRGIIIEENYSSNLDTENYVLLQQRSGNINSIKISEISKVRKEENKDYSPKFDIILNEGDVVVNRKAVEYVGLSEKNDVLYLDSINFKAEIAKDKKNSTTLTVEYRDKNFQNTEMFQLVKVTETVVKKKPSYCFSYKDLVDSVYPAQSIETSVNLTTKVEYIVGGQGVFALYDKKNKRAIPIIIK